MSYGLTPYDKQRYKESKQRRKQALIAAETGRILPYGTKKRKAVLITVVFIAVAVVGVVAFLTLKGFEQDQTEKNPVNSYQQYNDEDLLRVVNRQNPLESDFVPELKKVDGMSVNAIAYDSLVQMCKTANEQGIELKVIKGYVSYDMQKTEYENKLSELLADPEYTQVRAEAAAGKLVPKAGESEYQTGLLVKFDLNDSKTKAFVELNCVDNGFIQRYPKSKETETMLTADYSVYRFVGKENAVKMRSYNMSLEEYRLYLSQQPDKIS